ncbi:unnamed protein product [Amoebophrya sp. A120]|nr:unnamed protein product [Amoebophrya sp. A120]|eukprot:GSA120T00018324001.1
MTTLSSRRSCGRCRAKGRSHQRPRRTRIPATTGNNMLAVPLLSRRHTKKAGRWTTALQLRNKQLYRGSPLLLPSRLFSLWSLPSASSLLFPTTAVGSPTSGRGQEARTNEEPVLLQRSCWRRPG